MTRLLAALVLGASVLGLAACSGGGSALPPTNTVVQAPVNPDGGLLPPNH
ncbi:MAG TPA: hypothetical protein VNJ51_01015 [Candidatus Dormibacteraeota bacterium]|nr:hypothetical protein [Candidatus Dormibacteraeota bacterium]